MYTYCLLCFLEWLAGCPHTHTPPHIPTCITHTCPHTQSCHTHSICPHMLCTRNYSNKHILMHTHQTGHYSDCIHAHTLFQALAEQLVCEVRKLQQELARTQARLESAEDTISKMPSEGKLVTQLKSIHTQVYLTVAAPYTMIVWFCPLVVCSLITRQQGWYGDVWLVPNQWSIGSSCRNCTSPS